MKRITPRVFLLFLLVAWFGLAYAQSTQRPAYRLPVVNFEKDAQGFYINKTNEFYLRYMWESFVAINWPNATGERDSADLNELVPASRPPLVWETMPQPQEVFLPSNKWDNYPDWEHIPYLPAGMTVEQTQQLCIGFTVSKDIVLYDINQPNITIKDGPVAPLIDQYGRYVRYQVSMNRSYFEYVREHEYYDADVQKNAVMVSEKAQYNQKKQSPSGAFVGIPFDQGSEPGMLEIKAAWRVLDPKLDDPARYYTRPGYILSPDRTSCKRAPAGVGLVALHIHRITRLSHVASTFEQVDNIQILDPHTPENIQPSFNPGTSNATQQSIWPPYGNRGFAGKLPAIITAKNTLPPREHRQANNISRATPIPPSVRTINREFQQRYNHSVLRYYQMINVQHVQAGCKMRETGNFSNPQEWLPVTCPQPSGKRFINAALESYTQLVNPFTGQPSNYSCFGCHVYARPCGFAEENKNELTFRGDFQVMSYILSKAKFPGQQVAPDGYSCNNPATQPFP